MSNHATLDFLPPFHYTGSDTQFYCRHCITIKGVVMKNRMTFSFLIVCMILLTAKGVNAQTDDIEDQPQEHAWVCFFSGERGAFHISILGKGESYASPLFYLGTETEAVLSDIIWHVPFYDAKLQSSTVADVNADDMKELIVEFNLHGTSFYEEYVEEGGFGEEYWSQASLVCVVDFATRVTLVQLAYAECTLSTWTPGGVDDSETITFLETQSLPDAPWEFPVLLPYQYVETVYHHMYEDDPTYDEVVGFTNEVDIEIDFREDGWHFEEIPYAEEVEE
jgi:hypothetical protein